MPTRLTLRGRRVNGLPAGTLICIVAVLNLARHGEGVYVEPCLASLCAKLAWSQWGGSYWVIPVSKVWVTGAMVPTGAWLS